MAIFTAIGTAIAGALFAGSVLAANLIAGALAFGAQLALSYLNRPKQRAYSAVQGQREYGGRVPAWALFGKGKVQGHHIYYAKWGRGNRFNADVFLLSNGWCDGLEPEIHFYGEKHTLVPRTIIGNETEHWGVQGFDNLVSIRFFDGRPGQGPDTKLVSDTADLGQEWKSTSVCAGLAYVVVEKRYDSDKFEQGEPRFEFVMRGLRLYDPRLDDTVAGGDGDHRLDDPSTWEWSENPALHRLNYQLGIRGLISGRTIVGEGKTLGQLDLGSYFAAMNVCDTPRNGKPTYAASIFVTADDDHTEVLREFDDAMAGYGMNRRGLSGVIAGAPQVPVLDIGPDDIDMGRPRTIQRRKSAFDLFNHLSGQFISPEANWEPESLTPITVNAHVSADGRVRQESNDFLQVTDPDTAQYLLTIRYRQNRKGGSSTLPVSRRVGLQVLEGEWITHAGLTWLITGWSMDEELRVTLQLAETGDDVYAEGEILPGPIVVPPPPQANPSLLSTVQNFAIAAGMLTNEDGHDQPVLLATWTPPEDPSITQVRIEYKVDDGSGPGSLADLMKVASDDPEAGELVITGGVLSGKIYVARATITTVPDRLKTWTPWATTLEPTGRIAIRAILSDFGQDVYQTLQQVHADMDEMRARLEQLALAGAAAAGTQVESRAVAVRFQNAFAAALFEITAAVSDNDGNLIASAEILQAVTAVVEDFAAEGLLRFTAEAGEGNIVARVVLQVRASTADEFISAGTVWEAGFTDDDPPEAFSRVLINADQFGITNADGEPIALFTEDGEGTLYMQNIRLGTLVFDELRSHNDLLVITGSGDNASIEVFSPEEI